jgi:TRADD-N domain-containing protein
MSSLDWLSTAIPIAAVALAVISAIIAMGRGKLKFGSLIVDFDRSAASEIRSRLEAVGGAAGFRQYALLREYHAQGLAQSRVSFWFSLTFASIGFAVIALAVGLYVQGPPMSSGLLDNAGKPIFALVAGTN